MTTKKTSHHVSSVSESTSAADHVSSEETVAAPTPAAVAPVVFIKPPPPITSIPTAPEGYTNTTGADYRSALPKKLEQSAIPDVLEELARFTEYASIFGKTAPPLPFVLQTFTAAGQWTAMRVKTEAWDMFSRTQEGAAWSDARVIMESMRPAFMLAVKADATLARQFPGLVRLFEAKTVIARRGVETRKANAKDIAEGKPPSRGKAAKAAKKTAKLIAEAQSKAAPAPTAPTVTTPVAAAPVAVAPVHAATPVVASPPPTANPVTNGASGGAPAN